MDLGHCVRVGFPPMDQIKLTAELLAADTERTLTRQFVERGTSWIVAARADELSTVFRTFAG